MGAGPRPRHPDPDRSRRGHRRCAQGAQPLVAGVPVIDGLILAVAVMVAALLATKAVALLLDIVARAAVATLAVATGLAPGWLR